MVLHRLLKEPHLQWDPKAPAEARAPVVQAWEGWFDERRGEWDLSALEKAGRFVGDTQFGRYVGNLAQGAWRVIVTPEDRLRPDVSDYVLMLDGG